jgi:hypothetical protein
MLGLPCVCCLCDPNLYQVTCKAVVTTILSYNRAKVGGVSIAGKWTSLKTANNWPIVTGTSTTATTASSLGTVTLTAARTLPSTTGNGCAFTVTSWSKTGHVKDTTAVTGPVWLKW